MVSSDDRPDAPVHPRQLGVQDWSSYAMVIDARSPREFAEDHIPGATNLPVVDNDEYAEVGTTHRSDKHAAYLIGVAYSLRNIADQITPLISKFRPEDHFLVYCFRGGKRSRLWTDNLRTIGFDVDVLDGGWKAYRRWVRAGLERMPGAFSYRVLCGPTGCGKTRVLNELARQGHQVLDLEGLAHHRGSLLGDLPGDPQPSQKQFESDLLEAMRHFDAERPVWIEAESKKIGRLQLPEVLFGAMRQAPVVHLSTPMSERVRLWREDYPHLAADPSGMVRMLDPIMPLVGKEVFSRWQKLAATEQIDALFERVMTDHYDPCYARSTRKDFGGDAPLRSVATTALLGAGLADTASRVAAFGAAGCDDS
jgi:tRNA 2-selenouridine synthase